MDGSGTVTAISTPANPAAEPDTRESSDRVRVAVLDRELLLAPDQDLELLHRCDVSPLRRVPEPIAARGSGRSGSLKVVPALPA